jgi:hypothetical protein
MEVLKFFKENKNASYKHIEDILKNKYKLELRLDKSNDYFMISTTDYCDFSDIFIRQCSGIIIEKNTYNVLHYFGEIAYDINNDHCKNNNIKIEEINIQNCLISRYIDGYVIKIFKINKKWTFATSKHTNIRKYKINEKNITLYEIFKNSILNSFETIDDFLNSLDNIYCYSFILSNNKLYFLNKVDINKLEEYYNFNNFKYILNINDIINKNYEKYLIIEKRNDIIYRKTRISINDIKILFNKNNLCLYNNKCFNKYCNLKHLKNPDIEKNYKEYINYKRKINPLFKTQHCKNGDNCKQNMKSKCIFIHNNDPI